MKMKYQMNSLKIILFILILNFIVSLIYFFIKWRESDINRGFIMGIFIIICPIVGPLYLFFSWFVFQVYFKRRETDINIEELSLSKDRIDVIAKPDRISALNKVSLEDALIVSDKENVRKLLLDVLKRDKNDSIKAIFKAVEHKDSEVSHYAASAASSIINEFKTYEKQLRENYNKDKSNKSLSKKYVNYLNSFLTQNILSSAEQMFYCNRFEELVINMEGFLPLEISGDLYNKLVSVFLDLGEKKRAKVWVEKALNNNGNELESFKAGLRYYYESESRIEFLLLLEKLKKSDIHLDHDTLEMVRFFSR